MADWLQIFPQTPKSKDTQLPYVKWHSSMHTIGPLHPQTPNCGWKTAQVFIEKNLHISRPAEFKPMLFKGHCKSITLNETYIQLKYGHSPQDSSTNYKCNKAVFSCLYYFSSIPSVTCTLPNKILSLESLFHGLLLRTPRFTKILYFLPVAANSFASLY